MADPFHSAWMKWGWAVVEAEMLKLDLKAFALDAERNPLITATTKYEPRYHALICRVVTMRVLPHRTNLRLKPADLARVRSRQPYRYAERNHPLHALAVLRQLADFDKHREVKPLWIIPTGGTYEVTDVRDCTISRAPPRAISQPLKVDTEVTRIYVRKTGSDPHANVDFNLTGIPALNERLGLEEWLDKTRGFIVGLLHKLSDPPLEDLEALGLPGSGTAS